MATASVKPAPLNLGATERRDGTNRVELLPKPQAKPNPLVDQLLEDFARSAGKPTAPGRPPMPAPKPAAVEADELRLQMQVLERRLKSLEQRQEPRQEDVMYRRVLAVLEQLSAEIREHVGTA